MSSALPQFDAWQESQTRQVYPLYPGVLSLDLTSVSVSLVSTFLAAPPLRVVFVTVSDWLWSLHFNFSHMARNLTRVRNWASTITQPAIGEVVQVDAHKGTGWSSMHTSTLACEDASCTQAAQMMFHFNYNPGEHRQRVIVVTGDEQDRGLMPEASFN
jgi:hypothetical protein